jgi:hypothetical protein
VQALVLLLMLKRAAQTAATHINIVMNWFTERQQRVH